MKKKISLFCVCVLSVCLCACQRNIPETKSAPPETEQAVDQGDKWKEAYQNLILEKDVKRTALIYLDEDAIPELLLLQNGEYCLYTFDGSQIMAIDIADAGIRAKAYVPKHVLEGSSEDLAFYWFEYVPYQGLVRVHGSEDGERCDYYLSYKNGSLALGYQAKATSAIWHTYDAQQEITNEEFLSKLSDLGYDQLTPCGYLYGNIEDALENIGKTPNSREVLDDFINGKMDALYDVEEVTGIPEEGFVMRSYVDLYMNFIMGDGKGRMEYVDFDNDGEEELVMRDYMGNSIFLDVIGNTVRNVMEAYGTANQVYVAEMEGKRVVVSADVSHGGRKCYVIRQYDSCGCLVDFFRLLAFYEGEDNYSAEDEFEYREQPITMEEFEEIRDRIRDIPTENQNTMKNDELPEEFNSFKGKWVIGEYIGACLEEPYEEMSAEQRKAHEKWNAEYREQYEGYIFEIAEDSITFFMSPCELGYYYDDYQDILKFHRHPPRLELVPPYLHAWVQLKELDETFSIIIDGNGDAVLAVGDRFFELDRECSIKTVISPDEMFCILALDEDGYVWKWEEGKTKADAVAIVELEDVVQLVDTGCGSVYALTAEGDVYAWGMNRGWLIDPEESESNVMFPA